MGRYRINSENKARPVTVSLKPEDIERLKKLEKHFKKKRSLLIQEYIRSLYLQEFGGLK